MTAGQRQILAANNAAEFRRQHGLTRYRYDVLHRRARAAYDFVWADRAGIEAFYHLDRFGDVNVNHHMILRNVR